PAYRRCGFNPRHLRIAKSVLELKQTEFIKYRFFCVLLHVKISNQEMRFIVSTSALLKQLQAISVASSSSTVLPILENFLFEIKDNTLTISATDLQTSMVTSLPIEAKEEGRVAMTSKILIDTLKTLPDQPV